MAAVGIHRTVGVCRQLVKSGWLVTVVAAQPLAEEAQDLGTLADVPAEIRVVRTPAPNLLRAAARLLNICRKAKSAEGATPASVPSEPAPARPSTLNRTIDWFSWWLCVPDTKTSWIPGAACAGLREARRARPDVIFSTAPAWTSHLVAAILSRVLRVPWVADFRDPWYGSHFRVPPHAAHNRMNERLEKRVMAGATEVTCAWDGIRRLLAARYPHKAGHIRTVLNGFDPEQIDLIAPKAIENGRCVFLHAGNLYGPRSPVPLLNGLGFLKRDRPDLANRARLVFLGTAAYRNQALSELADLSGVGDLVRVIPMVPHKEAIAMLKASQVAVLLGQSGTVELASIPAKAYEYIGTGKPVLAIGSGDEVCNVMQRGGCRVWRTPDDPAGIASVLKDILTDHESTGPREQDNQASRLAFTRTHMAEDLEAVLRLAAAKGTRRPTAGSP
jgi:hypothetical protein